MLCYGSSSSRNNSTDNHDIHDNPDVKYTQSLYFFKSNLGYGQISDCHQGINSTYIRNGSKGSLKKIGYFCNMCNLHYDVNTKLYTVNEKVYTVFRDSQSP